MGLDNFVELTEVFIHRRICNTRMRVIFVQESRLCLRLFSSTTITHGTRFVRQCKLVIFA